MKHLLAAIFTIFFASHHEAVAEDLMVIYSKKNLDSTMTVVQISSFNFWPHRAGNRELALKFENSEGVQVSYGLCGLLCGALTEGLATRPSDKVLKLSNCDDQWVRFVDQSRTVEVQIKKMNIKLSYSEAKRLVDALLKYWNEIDADADSK